MRLLGRLTTLVVILVAAGLIVLLTRPIVAQMFPGAFIEAGQGRILTSLVYRLTDESWTRFPLSSPPRTIRVLSSAALPAGAVDEPLASFGYAIEYRIVGFAGDVLQEGALHYRARLNLIRDAETGAVRSRYALQGVEGVSSALYASALDLGDVPGAARLELRLGDREEGVLGASVRVAERRIPVGGLEAAWQRLSPAEQRQIARHHPYPPELLSDDERRSLIDNAWLPVGPAGVEGDDYVLGTLAARVGEGVASIEAGPRRLGLYLDETRLVTLRAPEGGGQLSILVDPLDTEATEGFLEITLYRTDGEREQGVVRWSLDRLSQTLHLGGGLLEFASPVPLRLRVLTEEGANLTAEQSRIRAYVASPGNDIAYPLLGAGAEELPMRLALRAFADAPGEAQAIYRVIDASGIVIEQDALAVAPDPSPYDRLAGDPTVAVSDPEIFFFRFPPEAALLVVSSEDPVLVTAATRLPESSDASLSEGVPAGPQEGPQPAWFMVRPDGWRDAAEGSGSLLIETLPRPSSSADSPPLPIDPLDDPAHQEEAGAIDGAP